MAAHFFLGLRPRIRTQPNLHFVDLTQYFGFCVVLTLKLHSHILISTLLQYADLPEEELDSKAGVVAGEAARISQFYSLLTSSIDVIYKFCDRIPGFNDLCKQDRELLFRYEGLLGNPQKRANSDKVN